MTYRVWAAFDVEADTPEEARKRVELTLPFFEANPWATVSAVASGLPNLPAVTAPQLVRYLCSRYANARRLGRLFSGTAGDSPDELASHYRSVADAYLHEAGFYRQIIEDVRRGHVQTWVVGGKVNTPEDGHRWGEYAGIIARRFGFRLEAVERFLRTLSDDPFDSYSQVVALDDGEPTGAAWRLVWEGIGQE